MNRDDIRAELELELNWRFDEMRWLRNQLPVEETKRISADQAIASRRTLLVMTYAHFEGFVKQAFSIYAEAINAESIPCGSLNSALVASTMARELKDLRSPAAVTDVSETDHERKRKRQLRTAERETKFVETIRTIDSNVRELPVDQVVSTDSNLSPAVLRRNLYRLGFDPEAFEKYDGIVEFVLQTRNDVAHGKKTNAIPIKKMQKAMQDLRLLMTAIVQLIDQAVRMGHFRAAGL